MTNRAKVPRDASGKAGRSGDAKSAKVAPRPRFEVADYLMGRILYEHIRWLERDAERRKMNNSDSQIADVLISIAEHLRNVVARNEATAQLFDEIDEQQTKSERVMLKREALVAKHHRNWSTVDRDLRDAARNGLSAARVPGRHGYWYEDEALKWAEAAGRAEGRSTADQLTTAWRNRSTG